MEKEFNFGFAKIVELGNIISEKLIEYGVGNESELVIYLKPEAFLKADEDLFYRIRNDDSEEFIPSEGEIDVKFENIKMTLRKLEDKT